MNHRYDVKLAGGKVFVDVGLGKAVGILVQDPVYVFSQEDQVKPRKTLQQGDEEYFLQSGAWFGATDKARMFVTVYDQEAEEETV